VLGHSGRVVRAAGSLVAVVVLAGCAAHRHAAGENGATLETFIEKVRQLSLQARPVRSQDATTLEHQDPELALVRLALAAAPTADHYRQVAEAYARLGVRDAAYSHFAAALRLDPHDAASLDGQARIWRDWGFPHLGLGDVYRAIALAPDAPAPRNTLGTLLLGVGQIAAARGAFERALALEPDAAYAINNLCYTAVLEGDHARAIARCRAAVTANPLLRKAHNNLALAYAAAGDFASASGEFRWAGSEAAERYNMGVALMATGHYREAAEAFDEAAALGPWRELARQRAERARQLAAPAVSPVPDAHDPMPK
jgi:tetratricopeptide (TPR) repeat protein